MNSINTISLPDLSHRPFDLSIERIISLPPEIIFKAWTEQLDSWFAAPGSVIMKPEVNQVFYFETASPTNRYPHYGRFLRIEKDKLIETTWVTGFNGTKGEESILTIDLKPIEGGTVMRITHSGFFDEKIRNQHEDAWPIILQHMESQLSKLHAEANQ